jgi:hypothetical protein
MYELEEVFHEEDPLRIARRLESEGWAKLLFPQWSSAKANEPEVERLRDVAGQLIVSGIVPDPSAALFPLLTAKLGGKETAALKHTFARPGFVEEIESLEARTKALATQFTSKEYAAPSAAWKLLYSADPQAVLSLVFGTKSGTVKQKFEQFFKEWPQARNRLPYALMQEMRITPELPVYNELVDKLFFAIMDARLETPEATRAFLEPYSPPAPPPPPNLRRRPAKRESRAAKKAPKAPKPAAPVPAEGAAIAASAAPAKGAKAAPEKAAQKPAPPPAKKTAAPVAAKAPAKVASAKAPAKKAAPKPPAKATAKPPAKKASAKTVKVAVKAAKKAPAKKAPAKKPAPKPKKAAKPVAKKPAPKSAAKNTPAKNKPAKPAKKARR